MKFYLVRAFLLAIWLPASFLSEAEGAADPNTASAFLIKKNDRALCLFAVSHANIVPYQATSAVNSCYIGSQAVGLETTANFEQSIFYKIYAPNINIQEKSLRSASVESVDLIKTGLKKLKLSDSDAERILDLHPMAAYRILINTVSSESSVMLYPGLDKLLQIMGEKEKLKITELEPPFILGEMERRTPFHIAVEKAEAAAKLTLDKIRLEQVKQNAISLQSNAVELKLDAICPQLYQFLETSLRLPKSYFGYEIEDRNENMVDNLEIMLLSNNKSIAAVGAGHFCGPKSIVNQLRNRGYEISPLN